MVTPSNLERLMRGSVGLVVIPCSPSMSIVLNSLSAGDRLQQGREKKSNQPASIVSAMPQTALHDMESWLGYKVL
jgi:hypothetical protein